MSLKFNLLKALIISILIGAPSLLTADGKNRVEELFIWKISEELKLSVSDEKKLAEAVKKFSKLKQENLSQINNSLETLKKLKKESDLKTEIANYEKLIEKSNQLQLQEGSEIKSILGIQGFSKFLVIRNELASRLKSALQEPLPPPKVIVE